MIKHDIHAKKFEAVLIFKIFWLAGAVQVLEMGLRAAESFDHNVFYILPHLGWVFTFFCAFLEHVGDRTLMPDVHLFF